MTKINANSVFPILITFATEETTLKKVSKASGFSITTIGYIYQAAIQTIASKEYKKRQLTFQVPCNIISAQRVADRCLELMRESNFRNYHAPKF